MPTVRRCCIVGCLSNSRQNPQLQFFQFPKPDNPFYKLWTQACHASLSHILPFKKPVVCALHFHKHCIGGRRLTASAVPTLNLEVPTNLKAAEQQAMVDEIERSRKCAYINAVVYEWLVRANLNPQLRGSITHGMIKEKAEAAKQMIVCESFTADNRWLNRFRESHLTGFAQKLASNQLKPMGPSLWIPDIVQDLQHLFPPTTAERLDNFDGMPEQYYNYIKQYGEYDDEEDAEADQSLGDTDTAQNYQQRQQQQQQQQQNHQQNSHSYYDQQKGYESYNQQQQSSDSSYNAYQDYYNQQRNGGNNSYGQNYHNQQSSKSLPTITRRRSGTPSSQLTVRQCASPYPRSIINSSTYKRRRSNNTNCNNSDIIVENSNQESRSSPTTTNAVTNSSANINDNSNIEDLTDGPEINNNNSNSNSNSHNQHQHQHQQQNHTDNDHPSNYKIKLPIIASMKTPQTNGSSSAPTSPKSTNGSMIVPTNGRISSSPSPSTTIITQPFKELENYTQALEYLKPLEDFVLFKENFRAIGLLSQLEIILRNSERSGQADLPE